MATGNPYDSRSEDPSERRLAKKWEEQQNNPLPIWDRNNVTFVQTGDSRSENPAERAQARDESLQQRTAFAQNYGLDYTGSTSPASGLMPEGRGMSQAMVWEDLLNRWTGNKDATLPTMNMTPEQKQQFLQQVYTNPGVDPKQFLTPEQRQVADTMFTFYDQNSGFDGFQKMLQAGAMFAFPALAGGGFSTVGAGAASGAGGGLNAISAADAAMIDAAGIGTGGGTMTGGFGLGTGAGEMGATLAGGGAELGSGMFNLGTGGLSATGGALGTGTAGVAGMAGLESLPTSGFDFANFVKTGAGLQGMTPPPIPPIPGGGSGLSNLLGPLSNLLPSGENDFTKTLGTLGSSLLGVAGSNAQGDAYSDVANKYLALGAPYRGLLEKSYQPGFDLSASDPAFAGALDTSAQAAARATSARVGNPVDNPGAYAEMQKYILNSSALPQLNTYRSQLGSFGQLGTNVAGTGDMNSASQAGGMYDALGSGLASLTKPKNPYEDMFKGLMGGFNLNTGNYL